VRVRHCVYERERDRSCARGQRIQLKFSVVHKRERQTDLQPKLGRHECTDRYDCSAGRGPQETRHVDTEAALSALSVCSGRCTLYLVKSLEWYASLQLSSVHHLTNRLPNHQT
jgi:hypothetical protein